MRSQRQRIIDEILVMRCQEGSGDAFELLARRWQRRLWRHALRLTGRHEAAWDVMQETWIAILKGIRRLGDPATFAAWAFRIVRNKSADHWRSDGRQKRLAADLAERNARPEPAGARGDAVGRAMSRMTPEKRELLALRYGEDLGINEIARILGVPHGTVKSRLHHAREDLKRRLEGESE